MENTVNREPLVSEFPSVRSKAPHTISIHDFIDTVRSDRFRQVVQDYRRLKALPGHEAEAQKLKDGMPCIIPAGVCSNGHAVKTCNNTANYSASTSTTATDAPGKSSSSPNRSPLLPPPLSASPKKETKC
ncbi:MAG: hypothetical protein ACLVL2_19110 [Bacteroides cellulosilyticus]